MTPVEYLLLKTKHPVYLCSLANEGSNTRTRQTRSKQGVESFLAQWDRPGRGMFFCVSTIKGTKRSKENATECCFLHADIDYKDAYALRRDQLNKLSLPPSILVSSGNGLHAYWYLTKAVPANERIEVLLKKIAAVVGGDTAVTHCAALMRLPGSHNTKRDTWKLVVTEGTGRRRYTLVQIAKWLKKAKPIEKPKDALAFFAAYGEESRPPLDVGERLVNMEYHGDGVSSIHTTQLSCSASMLQSGVPINDIVKVIIEATKSVAGKAGARWNWQTEERKVRKMCISWLNKSKHRAALKRRKYGQEDN